MAAVQIFAGTGAPVVAILVREGDGYAIQREIIAEGQSSIFEIPEGGWIKVEREADAEPVVEFATTRALGAEETLKGNEQ